MKDTTLSVVESGGEGSDYRNFRSLKSLAHIAAERLQGQRREGRVPSLGLAVVELRRLVGVTTNCHPSVP